MPQSTESAWSLLPLVPVDSSVRRIAFVSDELDGIAIELGQTLTLAPFQIHGDPVYRVVIPLSDAAVTPGIPVELVTNRPAAVTTLTLWPSLQRVDATNPWAAVVATGIIAVDLVTGVEAIFRHPGGSLTVVRNGRIMVRTGPASSNGRGRDAGEAER